MFAFLDNRIIDIYSLQNTQILANADGSTFDVVAWDLPEESRVLKNFASEADAEIYVTKIQNEIEKNEAVPILDLRTPA